MMTLFRSGQIRVIRHVYKVSNGTAYSYIFIIHKCHSSIARLISP